STCKIIIFFSVLRKEPHNSFFKTEHAEKQSTGVFMCLSTHISCYLSMVTRKKTKTVPWCPRRQHRRRPGVPGHMKQQLNLVQLLRLLCKLALCMAV
uniref:Uncharacterized protein n=2 Tax=Aegilops tauschii subsp. strangulata TaxID=200361 RepID=A0A453B2K4_AEGTS